jgi:hypothetical protein
MLVIARQLAGWNNCAMKGYYSQMQLPFGGPQLPVVLHSAVMLPEPPKHALAVQGTPRCVVLHADCQRAVENEAPPADCTPVGAPVQTAAAEDSRADMMSRSPWEDVCTLWHL